MGAIIWQKVTTCNTTGGATIMGSFPYPRNGIIKLDYEFILIFKKYGTAPTVSKEIKERSKLSIEEWNQYFTGHWHFAGEKQDQHLAMFPEELPRRLIKMFSFVGDTVLDPFLGSGTTSLAARNLERNCIGYEINDDSLPVIMEKIGIKQGHLFQDSNFEILQQGVPKVDFNEEIKKLPYIFHDPIKFDKKIDPRKMRFGSKIDISHSPKENYYIVKDVLSPETIVLNNGLEVKLMGVKENPVKSQEAVQFLKDKMKNQKVFLKYDATKHDSNNTLLVYLYLSNKTFVNAHMIKSGLVEVHTEYDFKYKEKFINLRKEPEHDLQKVR
jgi:site-specific DNA-methyltransferase (adenine-specific)